MVGVDSSDTLPPKDPGDCGALLALAARVGVVGLTESRVKSYGQREFILAYLDTQKEPFPHEDFRAFRQKRLAAMEVLFGVQISPATVSRERAALFLLFSAVARRYLAISRHDGWLEAGLLEMVIDRVDGPEVRIRETQARIHELLGKCETEQLTLLESLFVVMWGRLDKTVTAADLARFGVDDAAAPRESDYWDEA